MVLNESKQVVVLYKSFYGSTKQYAEWISEETGGDCFELDKMKVDDLVKYDVIVFGGGLYAAGINGMKSFKKMYEQFRDKKIIVWGVGLSPAEDKIINEVRDANFSVEMKEKVELYLLRGAYDQKKQNFTHKMIMKALEVKIKSKKSENLTAEDRGILECIKNSVDFMSKESIQPIIDAINQVL